MKTKRLLRILLIPFIAVCLPPALLAQDTVVHYYNLDDPLIYPDNPEVNGRTGKLGPSPGDGGVAQKFTVGADNVSSATLGLARIGSPGGKLVVSLWTVDSVTGYPGESIGTLAELELNSLSQIPWPPPATTDLVTVEGSVVGLTPFEEYYLVVDHDDEANITSNDGWVTEAVPSPTDADPALVFWYGRWQVLTGWSGMHLHARIAGALVTHTLAIDTIGNGAVTVSPEMAAYPRGTQVTLTSAPEPRHALVNWDGDAEGQEDSIVITLDADKSVTAEFGRVIAVGPHLYAFGEAKKSLGTPGYEEYPFISQDGLSMYFEGMRYDLLPATVASIFRVIRPSLDEPWGEPVDLMQNNVNSGLNYNWVLEPSLTDDGLTFYYESIRIANLDSWPTAARWLVVHRASTDDEFDFANAELLGPKMHNDHVVQGAVSDSVGPGAITRDGTGFVFTSERLGGSANGAIWFAPWDPVATEIGEPTLVASDLIKRYTAPEMSADGLTVTFLHPGDATWMVARASIDDPWSSPVTVPLGDGADHATLSPDLTRIYFTSDRSGSTPLDPRDPEADGGFGADIYEANMRRLPFPSVVLTSDSATYSTGEDVILTADVGKSERTIARVEFYAGETLLGESTEPPFTFTWSALAAGSYEVSARAVDDSGGAEVSATITIIVGEDLFAIIWITDHPSEAGQEFQDLLVASGLVVTEKHYTVPTVEQQAILNAADLVVVSRKVGSGSLNASTWDDSITAPLILMQAYLARSSRWGWVSGTTLVDATPTAIIVNVPDHPVFAGLDVSSEFIDPWHIAVDRGTSLTVDAPAPGGTVIASALEGDVVVEWPAGTVAVGPRMLFNAGSREPNGAGLGDAGKYDLTADGEAAFVNAVRYMAGLKVNPPTEDPVVHLTANGNGTVTIRWTGTPVLETAPTVAGPWIPVADAANPYTANTDGTTFFRTVTE